MVGPPNKAFSQYSHFDAKSLKHDKNFCKQEEALKDQFELDKREFEEIYSIKEQKKAAQENRATSESPSDLSKNSKTSIREMAFNEEAEDKSQFSAQHRQITVIQMSQQDAQSHYHMVSKEPAGENLDSKTVFGKRVKEESLYHEGKKGRDVTAKSEAPQRNQFFKRESRNVFGLIHGESCYHLPDDLKKEIDEEEEEEKQESYEGSENSASISQESLKANTQAIQEDIRKINKRKQMLKIGTQDADTNLNNSGEMS